MSQDERDIALLPGVAGESPPEDFVPQPVDRPAAEIPADAPTTAGRVEQLPNGKYALWWRARCRRTGRELKFRSAVPFWPGSLDVMQQWADQFFRGLEVLEYRPWSASEDGRRIDYPVPVQHVKFDVKIPDLAAPQPRRGASLLVRPSLLSGRSTLGKSLI